MAARAQPPKGGRNSPPPSQPDDPPTGPEGRDQGSLIDAIREHVLRALGRPGEPGLVQVRPLWEDFYRVNLFVGEGPGGVTIADSYFVEADGQGNIIESSPPLTPKG